MSLKAVLLQAYGVKAYQVNGPPWLDTEKYDIFATTPAGSAKDAIPEMFKSLLADRFHLALHRQSITEPVYVLVVGKTEPTLKPVDPATAGYRINIDRDKYQIKGRLPLSSLVANLSNRLGTPVLDLTGLKETYEIDMTWAREQLAPSATTAESAGNADPTPSDSSPSIFTAVKESLGLKLEARKYSIELLVIDRIERIPTEN